MAADWSGQLFRGNNPEPSEWTPEEILEWASHLENDVLDSFWKDARPRVVPGDAMDRPNSCGSHASFIRLLDSRSSVATLMPRSECSMSHTDGFNLYRSARSWRSRLNMSAQSWFAESSRVGSAATIMNCTIGSNFAFGNWCVLEDDATIIVRLPAAASSICNPDKTIELPLSEGEGFVGLSRSSSGVVAVVVRTIYDSVSKRNSTDQDFSCPFILKDIATPPWDRLPSIGSWLLRPCPPILKDIDAKRWDRLPSVGSWLLRPPCRHMVTVAAEEGGARLDKPPSASATTWFLESPTCRRLAGKFSPPVATVARSYLQALYITCRAGQGASLEKRLYKLVSHAYLRTVYTVVSTRVSMKEPAALCIQSRWRGHQAHCRNRSEQAWYCRPSVGTWLSVRLGCNTSGTAAKMGTAALVHALKRSDCTHGSRRYSFEDWTCRGCNVQNCAALVRCWYCGKSWSTRTAANSTALAQDATWRSRAVAASPHSQPQELALSKTHFKPYAGDAGGKGVWMVQSSVEHRWQMLDHPSSIIGGSGMGSNSCSTPDQQSERHRHHEIKRANKMMKKNKSALTVLQEAVSFCQPPSPSQSPKALAALKTQNRGKLMPIVLEHHHIHRHVHRHLHDVISEPHPEWGPNTIQGRGGEVAALASLTVGSDVAPLAGPAEPLSYPSFQPPARQLPNAPSEPLSPLSLSASEASRCLHKLPPPPVPPPCSAGLASPAGGDCADSIVGRMLLGRVASVPSLGFAARVENAASSLVSVSPNSPNAHGANIGVVNRLPQKSVGRRSGRQCASTPVLPKITSPSSVNKAARPDWQD